MPACVLPTSRRGGTFAILRWRLRGGRAGWPEWIENRCFPAPPEYVEPGMAAITFIGHATFLLRPGGLTGLTEPIFSKPCPPVSWAGPQPLPVAGAAGRERG